MKLFTPFRLYPYFLALVLFFSLSSCNTSEPEVPEEEEVVVGPTEGNVPYITINTGVNNIQDDPKIPAQMTVFIDQEEVLNTAIGIEYRGSTSYTLFEKKSYGFETQDEAEEGISIEILGLNEEEDWILYGPYSDKTFLRNVLIYELSNDIGQYAVKTKFAELQINDDYKGVYVLMEKIKRDKNRVDIKKLEPEDTDAEDITGGYILKIDKTSGDGNGDASYTQTLGFRSMYGVNGNELEYEPYGGKRGEETYFLYEYPKEDDITTQQKEYIQAYMSDFEEALLTDDFSLSERTYTGFIDSNSFVDFFLLNELSANPDAYRISTFMHKNRGGKLKMGPIWDFNIAFGNDGRSGTQGWIYQYNIYNPNDLWLVPFWWERLMEDSQFKALVKTRWNELKSSTFSQTNIESKMDAHISFLEENGSIDRNYARWEVMGTALPFNSYVGATYEEEVNYVRGWIQDRIQWMDGQIQAF